MSEPTNNSSVELNTPKVGPSAPIEGPDALTASEQKHRPGRNERDGKHMSRGHLILRRFWRPVGSKVGVIGLALVVLLAAIGPYIANWDYWVVDDNAFLSPPDQYHWFGTSQGGFDLFAMTVEGLRKSLIIGFCVALIVETLAALIGSAAAYFGKVAEKAIPWFIDLLLVIPSFLIIAILSQHTSGKSTSTLLLIVLLSAFSWMLSARVVRAMTVPPFTIIVKHVIPNIASYLIIDLALGVVAAIMSETVLSFFGFGVQKPETSLGTLLGDGMTAVTTSPWLFMFPAGVLVILLLSVNFIGDGLRDAVDPSSKSGGKA